MREHNDCNNEQGWGTREIKGIARIGWLARRLWYVRFVLNWAWEPDRYDFDRRVEHWGLYKNSVLHGGERIFFFDAITESLQYSVPDFRAMVSEEKWHHLGTMEKMIAEVTRFFIFSMHRLERRERIEGEKRLLREIYTRSVTHQRPIVMALGNPFTLRMLRRIKTAEVKIIGEAHFRSKNRIEKRIYGETVPHYAILVNFLASERATGPDDAAWWLECLGGELPEWPTETKESVTNWWQAL